MADWIRGLALLRHPELIRELGQRVAHLKQIHEIRRASPTCRVSERVILRNFESGRLELCEGVTLSEGVVLSFGNTQTGPGRIDIGADTWVGEYNNFRTGPFQISIGQRCLISQFCTLVAAGHGIARDAPIQNQSAPTDKSGVILGNDVWLGAGVTITPGVRIGTGAVIGAGAVVTKDVGEYEIWAGVPARKIGTRQ